MSLKTARLIVIFIFIAILAGIVQGIPTAVAATADVLFLR